MKSHFWHWYIQNGLLIDLIKQVLSEEIEISWKTIPSTKGDNQLAENVFFVH